MIIDRKTCSLSEMASEPWPSGLLTNNQGFSQWFYSCSLMEWRQVGKLQTKKFHFLLNPRNQCKAHKQYIFFYSHDMLQDADSNA